MTIEQTNNNHKGYFTALESGQEAGRMTYTLAGSDKLIIDHTEVNPEFAGKGIGKELVLKIVTYARETHIKIIPLCPFAKAVFDKNIELQDILV